MVKKMVKKFPPTENDLRLKRPDVPLSEMIFYEIIDDLSNDWVVWHSVEWIDEPEMRVGEADFLLFNHNYGFLVIEVKGGIITYRDDIFYQKNQKTGKITKMQDPFHQARKSTYFFRNYYIKKALLESTPRELLYFSGKKGNFPLYYNSGVFFPGSYFKIDNKGLAGSLRTPFDKIFDKSDCKEQEIWVEQKQKGTTPPPLEKFLISLFEGFKKRSLKFPKLKFYFPKLISPNIVTAFRLNRYLEERNEELIVINEEQKIILDSLSVKPHCIFKGSAGSGKTFLAIKKALLNYKEGKITLFLCFNKELRDFLYNYFLKKFKNKDSAWHKKIQVYSINLFLSVICEKLFDFNTTKQIKNEIFNFQYANVAHKIKTEVENQKFISTFKFDAVLVDEAQDMDESLWNMFTYFLKDPQESIYYIFYDPEQALFVKNFDPTRFGLDMVNDLILRQRNIRNTTQIAHWLKDKTTYGEYKEFSGIKGFDIDDNNQFDNPVEAINFIINEIKDNILKSEVETEKIGILSYYKLNTVFNKVRENNLCNYLWFKNDGEPKFDSMFVVEPNNIKDLSALKRTLNKWVLLFTTISSFKGLEKDIIFLLVPKLELFKQENPSQYKFLIMQIYVGASRAKFKLYLVEY